ncbi:MAG TPA: hypothetical protein VN229_16865 [Terriglobales bacterium]|nr:hypothetical protein [Terriglobales bacterium]
MSSETGPVHTLPAQRASLGPWLWLLIAEKCVWHPITVLRQLYVFIQAGGGDFFSRLVAHADATVLVRCTTAILLFVAGMLLAFYRRRPAVWAMIAALWLATLLEWFRLWLLGPIFRSHFSPDTWLYWIGLIFSPVAWTAYLMESPIVAAAFPRREAGRILLPTSAQPLPPLEDNRSLRYLWASMASLGPWILTWILWRVIWVPILWSALLLHLEKSGRLWSDHGFNMHHPWALALGLAIDVGAAICATMLIFRRQRSTIMLVVILIWLLLLGGWAIDIGIDLDERQLPTGTRDLIVAINYLFWPLSWTAYFLESARVARLYPTRGEAALPAEVNDVF